jgi:LacI family transcriptional regulator
VPTIADVARAAGVGLGTASRALSGGALVAPSTRARVLAAAERLGYRANPIARAFARRRTHTVEVLVPLLSAHMYVEILRGIEQALAATSYTLVIRTIEHPTDRARVFEACCGQDRADGVLIVGLRPPEKLVQRLVRSSQPTVLVECEHPELPSVVLDYAAAADAAVRHCVKLGHRRIGLIDRDDDPFEASSDTQRRQGFRSAMAAVGAEVPEDYECSAALSPQAGAAAVDGLLELPEPPTAVIVASDVQAVGALEAARRRGVRVPEDLSVVGNHDIELAEYLGLTTLRAPIRELGRRAAELLLRALNGGGPLEPQIVRLPMELVVRTTCSPPGQPSPSASARGAAEDASR